MVGKFYTFPCEMPPDFISLCIDKLVCQLFINNRVKDIKERIYYDCNWSVKHSTVNPNYVGDVKEIAD